MKEYQFSIFVEYPKNCKITINNENISSIIVPDGTKVNWKIEKDGYKTEQGDITVTTEIEFWLKLLPKKEEVFDKSKEYYTKILKNRKGDYYFKYMSLSKNTLPETEGHSGEFLFTENGYLSWKIITPNDIFSPKDTDIGRYLQFDGENFIFSNPLPNPPDDSSDYVLHHIGGEPIWISKEAMPATWGNIEGDISLQQDLINILTQINSDISEVSDFVNKFSIDENSGLEFKDGKLSLKSDRIIPYKSAFDCLDQIKKRLRIFELSVDTRLGMRATAPDYSQIEYPTLNSHNIFSINKHYWAIIESSQKGDEVQVFDSFRDSEGNVIAPNMEKYLATIYRNSSGNNDLHYVLLTKSYSYKVLNPETTSIILVGEMPYGSTP